MANHDFFVSGDATAGRQIVEKAVTDLGYRISTRADGQLKLERGKKSTTMWIGAFAGKNFYVMFYADYFTGPSGELVARITSNTAGGLVGGAIGVSKAADAYKELTASVQQALHNAGALTNVVTG